MRKLLILIVFVGIALPSFAQQTYSAVKTSTEGGRWEIIQSPIVRRITIKLDKFTGKTYQLVETSTKSYSWQEILWIGEMLEEKYKNKINYQLFTGGLTVKDTYLINIHTGQTWMLYGDTSDNSIFWATMIE